MAVKSWIYYLRKNMELFNLFNKNIKDDDYILFSNWLNKVLENELPNDIIAYNFNLYEGNKNTYDIQLVGTNEYDENDDDWACTEYFTTAENICYIKRVNKIKKWEDGLIYLTEIVKKYLEEGKFSKILKKAKIIGIGFVAGDIDIIYINSPK
jgi:hypothetical protein